MFTLLYDSDTHAHTRIHSNAYKHTRTVRSHTCMHACTRHTLSTSVCPLKVRQMVRWFGMYERMRKETSSYRRFIFHFALSYSPIHATSHSRKALNVFCGCVFRFWILVLLLLRLKLKHSVHFILVSFIHQIFVICPPHLCTISMLYVLRMPQMSSNAHHFYGWLLNLLNEKSEWSDIYFDNRQSD